MFEFIKKKKTGGNGPGKDESDGEALDIEAPDVDGTLSDLDAALAAADKVKAQKVKDEAAERDRLRERERARANTGSSCGCGGGSW